MSLISCNFMDVMLICHASNATFQNKPIDSYVQEEAIIWCRWQETHGSLPDAFGIIQDVPQRQHEGSQSIDICKRQPESTFSWSHPQKGFLLNLYLTLLSQLGKIFTLISKRFQSWPIVHKYVEDRDRSSGLISLNSSRMITLLH